MQDLERNYYLVNGSEDKLIVNLRNQHVIDRDYIGIVMSLAILFFICLSNY